jgi:hypothetical protein
LTNSAALATLPYPEYLEEIHKIAIELAARNSHVLAGITLDAFTRPETAPVAAAIWDKFLAMVDPTATELFFTDVAHELAGEHPRLALIWAHTALAETASHSCDGRPRLTKIL